MTNANPAWTDPSWHAERADNAWAKGCRRLQSWWRETQLGLPPGEVSASRPRRVASMLPLHTPRDANFLHDDAVAAVDHRLAEPGSAGIINPDRLYRNLLSSQPLCFNLFGRFFHEKHHLLPWVKTLDNDAVEVTELRFEWAPPRNRHFGGGSAFDCLIVYRTAGQSTRFVGVETKYAENLASSTINVREPYFDFTRQSAEWREGAAGRLDVKRLRQFWLNTLLAQSCVDKREEGFEQGVCVVMACEHDVAARDATALVRFDLQHPDSWLRWTPYEDLIATLSEPELSDWRTRFETRYLNFGPIVQLLEDNDPRQRGADVHHAALDRLERALGDLLAMGERVIGNGSILEQIAVAARRGVLTASTIDIAAVAQRAEVLSLDLKTLRQASYEVWDRIAEADQPRAPDESRS